MDTSEILSHPRYGKDPMFLFVELLVVDTIEGLSSETAAWIAQIIRTDLAGWREKVKTISSLSPTFEVAVLDLWFRNSRITADRGDVLTPRDFSVLFVDKYYEEGSQIDVWGPGALAQARERIASEQMSRHQ